MFGITEVPCKVPVRWQALQTAAFCSIACAWALLTAKPASRSSARRMDRLGTMSVGEHVIFIATLVIQLRIAARADNDILLAIQHISRCRRVNARIGLVTPQLFAGGRVIRTEFTAAFAGKDQSTGSGQNPAEHRQRSLDLPANLPGAVM